MRFAYIDSQGKEVGIPSVEGLALRIELGAINESTRLYDSSTDRWAPAGEHEIYRSLIREIEERSEGTFVAPPPPVPGPKATEDAPAPPGDAREGEDAGTSAGDAGPEDSGEEDPLAAAAAALGDAPPRQRAPDPFAMEEGPGDAPPAGEAAPPSDEPPAGPVDAGEEEEDPFDLALELRDEDEVAAEAAEAKEAEDYGLGDLGDLDLEPTALVEEEPEPDELEPEEPEPAEPPAAAAPTVDDPWGGEGLALEEPAGTPGEGAGAGEGDRLEVEDALAASYSFDEDDDEGSVDPSAVELESSLSDWEGSAEDAPAWMREEEGAEGWVDSEKAPPAPSRDEEGERAADREAEVAARREAAIARRRAREAREGPEARERVDAGGRGGARAAPSPGVGAGLIWGLVLVAVAAGGWFGWSLLSGAREGAVVDEGPEVELPPLAAELEPTMRAAADSALGATVAALEELGGVDGLADAPPEDWLGGVYLANAGDYPAVAAYWEGLDGWVETVRDREDELFAAALDSILGGTELDPDAADRVRVRALAGFEAAGRERRAAYRSFQAVVDAALGLHEFLLERQEEISWEPAASGRSRDPVLEAVPDTPELGEEMWSRVERITAALDELGSLNRITTDGLVGLLQTRFEAAGVR